MIINKPNNISVCFIGGDLSITKKQEENLSELKDKYLVEFLHRGHKFEKSYSSFSQVVNEFVVESKSEFLVFINPKVDPKTEQVEDLIEKLCSGFCWVSRINFGFWATTKELFRNVGLMDERFVGGEHEDNDFIIRLKEFGKAIYWQYKLDEYPFYVRFPYSDNRGISKNIFTKKWLESENEIFIDTKTKEKQLPLLIRLDRNYEIYNSWLNVENSILIDCEHFTGLEQFKKNIIRVDYDYESKYCDCSIRLKCENRVMFIEFLCVEDTFIDVCMINLEDQRICCRPKVVRSNHWNSDGLLPDTDQHLEIKIFHDGDKIYHNKFIKIPFDLNINIGLKITNRIYK